MKVHSLCLWVGCIQEAPPPLHTQTHTHTVQLLYILKHAVSLRSSKENAFFLFAAAMLLRPLSVCVCVWCVRMPVYVYMCAALMTK